MKRNLKEAMGSRGDREERRKGKVEGKGEEEEERSGGRRRIIVR